MCDRQNYYLVNVGLAGGVHRLLQFWHVNFDVFAAEGLAGLGQVLTGLRRPVNDDKLSGFHLVYDLLNGVPVRTALVIDVHDSSSEGHNRWINTPYLGQSAIKVWPNNTTISFEKKKYTYITTLTEMNDLSQYDYSIIK